MFETTFKGSSKSLSEAKLQNVVILLNCLANDSWSRTITLKNMLAHDTSFW